MRSEGFAGEGLILRVDLSRGPHSTESVEPYLEDYIGGRGVGTRILYDEMPAGTDPLSPESIIIFNNGPLSGTAAMASGRVDVSAKSPLNNLHAVTNVGGYWGVELRHAGYLHLVISGARETPGYLYIDNDRVEVRDASHLWGLDTYETTAQLRRELGDEDTQVLSIGPAGENLVLFANVVTNMGDAAGRYGIGAVLGSKKLKAIAVRGTRGVTPAEPRRFLDLARETHRRFRESPVFKDRDKEPRYAGVTSERFVYSGYAGNFEDGYWDKFSRADVEKFYSQRLVRDAACFGCALQCKNLVDVPGLGHGIGGCMDYLSFGSNVWNEDLATMWEAIVLANRYGLDIVDTGGIIAFLMELHKKGIITSKDTDGVPMSRGGREAILSTIHKIATREGIGGMLAGGIRNAAEALGRDAVDCVVETKGMFPHAYAFPAFEGASLLQAVGRPDNFSPNGQHVEALLSMPGRFDRLLDEARERFGSEEAYLPGNYSPVKVRMVIESEHRARIPDLLGVCFKPYVGSGQLFPFDTLVALHNTATGRPLSSAALVRAAERLVNLERLLDAREGLTRADDTLPQRFFRPLPSGVHRGKALDPEKMEEMKTVYYRMRGWDPETGLPTPEKLRELGLSTPADARDPARCTP